MNLTFKELQKRDVVNVADGKCLGRITDLTLSFPKGIFKGITVPGRKTNCITRLFNKTEQYIEEKNIIKIGGDVILVDLRCGDSLAGNVDVNIPPKCPKPEGNLDCFKNSKRENEGEIDYGDY